MSIITFDWTPQSQPLLAKNYPKPMFHPMDSNTPQYSKPGLALRFNDEYTTAINILTDTKTVIESISNNPVTIMIFSFDFGFIFNWFSVKQLLETVDCQPLPLILIF